MELDEIQAEIFLLLNQMENQPEDRFGLLLQIQEKLHQMQAFGMTPPEDLVALVNELDAEFTAEARSGDIRSVSPENE
jgi:TorA maturation chaperone TorD